MLKDESTVMLEEEEEEYSDSLDNIEGSSISVDEKQNGHIYGVLPYLAPEVLKGSVINLQYKRNTMLKTLIT
ncbi:19767_t:CDS:2 [Cetraspora pellucida]|uniref:19767_t:CDS:1 n=1 Tax=Cetraspora pellucida TaxID=1433469 RepID=A0A9N8ZFL9_9GLOM|nr:19767_t:CDS:2 [Cetraspora pellucida]